MRYISDFKENDRVIDHYLCKQKQTLKTRTGKTYLSLRLQDKTGQIEGKVWEVNNDIQSFEEGGFIKIDGVVLTYQSDYQIKITKIRRSMEGEYEPSDYIPRTDKDIDELYRQLTEYVKSLTNPFISGLVQEILINNPDVAGAIKTRSAAKNMHHSYMGGLLEHTLSVTQICDFMSGRYENVNRDLLVATAILHDIGKVYELSDFPENDYTDDGQLIGHIVIGARLAADAAGTIPGFPPELKSLIVHSILAHHGEYEFGSPKKPKTIEAFILHCADNMDAKVKMFQEYAKGDAPGKWVGYNKILARDVRKTVF